MAQKKKSAKKKAAKPKTTAKKKAAPKKRKLAAKAPAKKKVVVVAKKVVAKKASAKKAKAAPKKRPAPKPPARKREDDAFLRGGARSRDALAEGLGEQWVHSATTGEDDAEETFNAEVPEERGGPFVVTSGGQEFAEGTDESNPKGAGREPFPRT